MGRFLHTALSSWKWIEKKTKTKFKFNFYLLIEHPERRPHLPRVLQQCCLFANKTLLRISTLTTPPCAALLLCSSACNVGLLGRIRIIFPEVHHSQNSSTVYNLFNCIFKNCGIIGISLAISKLSRSLKKNEQKKIDYFKFYVGILTSESICCVLTGNMV